MLIEGLERDRKVDQISTKSSDIIFGPNANFHAFALICVLIIAVFKDSLSLQSSGSRNTREDDILIDGRQA